MRGTLRTIIIAVFALISVAAHAAEPFGDHWTATTRLASKANYAHTIIDFDWRQLKACTKLDCALGARNLLRIIHDAEHAADPLDQANSAINAAITPKEEPPGIDDWQSPVETFTLKTGDCEDYAIAKYEAFRWLGVSADDLRLVVVWVPKVGEHHVILMARTGNIWRAYDNRRGDVITDADLHDYTPEILIRGTETFQYQP